MNVKKGDKKALVVAKRSRKNLEFIFEQKKQGKDVEEFTQLINSMLGMLIFLREEYLKDRVVDWKELQVLGLAPILVEGNAASPRRPALKQSKTFSKLISNLRHAFSHNNFDLLGQPTITGIRVWTVPFKKENLPKNRDWQATISGKQLRALAYLLIDFLEKKHGN